MVHFRLRSNIKSIWQHRIWFFYQRHPFQSHFLHFTLRVFSRKYNTLRHSF